MTSRNSFSGKVLAGLLWTLGLCGAVGVVVVQYRNLAELRQENESLRKSAADKESVHPSGAELEKFRAENQQIDHLRRENQDIQRLRAEAQELREHAKGLVQLQAENLALRLDRDSFQRTQAQAETPQPESPPPAALVELEEAKTELVRRVGASRLMAAALLQYAQSHNDELPNDLTRIRDTAGEGESGKIDFSAYEMLTTGKLTELQDAAKAPVAREKQKDARGLRVYVFADGHAELKREDE